MNLSKRIFLFLAALCAFASLAEAGGRHGGHNDWNWNTYNWNFDFSNLFGGQNSFDYDNCDWTNFDWSNCDWSNFDWSCFDYEDFDWSSCNFDWSHFDWENCGIDWDNCDFDWKDCDFDWDKCDNNPPPPPTCDVPDSGVTGFLLLAGLAGIAAIRRRIK